MEWVEGESLFNLTQVATITSAWVDLETCQLHIVLVTTYPAIHKLWGGESG